MGDVHTCNPAGIKKPAHIEKRGNDWFFYAGSVPFKINCCPYCEKQLTPPKECDLCGEPSYIVERQFVPSAEAWHMVCNKCQHKYRTLTEAQIV